MSESEKIISYETLETLNQKAMLEGALGYAYRIGELLQSEKSIEEIQQIVNSDAQDMSAALGQHCKKELEAAGFEYGLLKDALRVAPITH